ncbi:MAG: hypothetical protein ACI4XE_08900, partial [Acutalibacteraceae bacterium]
MNRIEIKANEVVVKRNHLLIVLGVFALGMGITAVLGLVDFLMLGPPEPGDEFMQAFTLLYIFAGTVLFFGMGVYSITTGFNRIVIDSDGVFCKGLFGEKKLIWQEISDYGMFLSGRSMGYSEYILYFSREVLPLNKKQTKKKLRGRAVFAYVHYRGE